MISYDDIRQLQNYPSGPGTAVLSVYLDVDQSKAANLNRGFETAAEDQLRQVLEQRADSANGEMIKLESERERIIRFLRDYTPRGKSLVIFSDTSRGLWWQRELQLNLPSAARWSPQPWVRPLLEIIDQRDRLLAILIDRNRARMLLLDDSGLSQQSDILSDVPNRHQTTGTDHIWSQGQMERDRMKHLKWHARRVADEAGALAEKLKLTRLVVGGPVEATTVFIQELPKRLQQMIVRTMPAAVDIEPDRLKNELFVILEQAELKDEIKIVESLITSARKGDRAVVGLAETLDAVNQGRVYRLVVDKTFRTGGKHCVSCNVLLPAMQEECSFCGGRLEQAPDLINRASHKVLESSGKVQVVSGPAADQLKNAGNIGAVLRF